ncbi:ankyrin repeat and SOCS box protein 13-like isoform X2 [Megalops cyprinoides]|uniref:ankyrin repeat and SOCS box protein 13-like isoform X2 n=1 Tax=Megalops cyprinoides TaxID=118141 RepID=UPI0018656016|nr:ankyrin repeat and SOCS box protein 13-like isoform X2 [Megalops cyprinoides]
MDIDPDRPYFFEDIVEPENLLVGISRLFSKKLTKKQRILLHIRCWSERTEVHNAAALGHVSKLEELIQSGASVNTATVDSITPLHEACIQGQTQCARLLLDAGAQVDVRSVHGSTPLCNACAAGSPECAKLLLEHGATANPTLTALTATPLHEACIRGNVDCVKLMIAEGAQLEAFDIYFGTPLHAACIKEHVDCAKALLIAGANVNGAKFHETALHCAAKVRNVDLIELLVEFGGNVYARDNLGRKPIDYTRPGSPPALCLQFYECTPLSLQHLSRVALRVALGTRALEVVSKLNVSPRIISYLTYSS